MRSSIAFVMMLLIAIDMLITVPAKSQTSSSETTTALFYGSGKPLLRSVLRDLVSSIARGVESSVYLVGGIPNFVVYKVNDTSTYLGIDIVFNNASLSELNPKFFSIEIGGFYTKTVYTINNSEIRLYTAPLYNTSSFYISICSTSPNLFNTITIDLKLYENYSVLYTSNRKIVADVNGIIFEVYTLAEKAGIGTVNRSIIISATIPSGQCVNTLIGFGNILDEVANNVVKYLDYTKNAFSDVVSHFPVPQMSNLELKNLYVLSIYNTVNMMTHGGIEDNLINVLPEEASSYVYLSKLSNIRTDASWFAKKFYSNHSFYIALASYIYYYPESLRTMPKELIEELIDSLTRLVDASNRSSDLAKIYSAAEMVYMAAQYVGDGYTATRVEAIRNAVVDKLKSLFLGYAYAPSADYRTISLDNVIEEASIAIYSVPNSDKHMEYLASFISSTNISSMPIERRFIVDALEAFSRYGHLDLVLRMMPIYYMYVLYRGMPCIDFYRVVLRGFLGIQPVLDTITFSPNVPMAMTNTSLEAYLCGKPIFLQYLNWGSKPTQIYLDTFYYPETAIPCNIINGYKRVLIVLEKMFLAPIYIKLFIGGIPAKNSFLELYTESGYSAFGYTNDSGTAVFNIPCNEKWVTIKLNNTMISIDTSNWNCKELVLSVNIPMASAHKEEEIDIVNRTIGGVLNNVNSMMIEINRTKNILSQLTMQIESNLSRISKDVQTMQKDLDLLHQKQNILNTLLYISLIVATFSLALSILSLAKRK
ncbi:MAG: hypothetical protein QW348_00315 [Ignisphaera sp.]